MELTWRGRRQVLYSAVAAVAAILLLVIVWQAFFANTPTCFDGAQNSNETGIDCGGSCALLCPADARAPVVLWTRAFRTGAQTYTAAVYVENRNVGAGSKQVPYSFQLFDERNILVVEKTGVIDLPPTQTIPIIEPNIVVGTRTVARTLFSFLDTPAWSKMSAEILSQLRVTNEQLSADASRLSAVLVNDSVEPADTVMVAAVLFDSLGTARAASRTALDRVPKKSSQEIFFTWSGGVPDIVRAEITVLPSLSR